MKQIDLFGNVEIVYDRNKIVDDLLLRGSNFEGGKTRIYNEYKNAKAPLQRIAFLKNEYGTGGFSFGEESSDSSGIFNFSPSGLSVSCNGETFGLSWNDVDERISRLVYTGQYLKENT